MMRGAAECWSDVQLQSAWTEHERSSKQGHTPGGRPSLSDSRQYSFRPTASCVCACVHDGMCGCLCACVCMRTHECVPYFSCVCVYACVSVATGLHKGLNA